MFDLSSKHIQLRNRDGYRFHHERDITYLFPLTLLKVAEKIYYDLQYLPVLDHLCKNYNITPQDIAEGFQALDRFIGECSKASHIESSNEGFKHAWVTSRMDRVKPAVITIIMSEIGLVLTKAYYEHCRSIIPYGSNVMGYDLVAESLDRSAHQIKQDLPHKAERLQQEKEKFVSEVEQSGIPPVPEKFENT